MLVAVSDCGSIIESEDADAMSLYGCCRNAEVNKRGFTGRLASGNPLWLQQMRRANRPIADGAPERILGRRCT